MHCSYSINSIVINDNCRISQQASESPCINYYYAAGVLLLRRLRRRLLEDLRLREDLRRRELPLPLRLLAAGLPPRLLASDAIDADVGGTNVFGGVGVVGCGVGGGSVATNLPL